MDTCRTDNVGVPRCTNAACLNAGQGCSTSADCCNGLPCVPNPNGTSPAFVCYGGGGSCVPTCGGCTINADCCAGETCIVAQGSTAGFCGPCGSMSDAGAPPEGGTSGGDSGPTTDAGGSSGGGTADAAADAGNTCALYGQNCTVNADCCNGVPCTGGHCVVP
jgi:hypothetical protein